ncbi:MAG: hypothetical protein OEM59_16680, partial [Rhodospirillales bacterium]|nr:hypothetical protein [Rhodospirillales bacterium]
IWVFWVPGSVTGGFLLQRGDHEYHHGNKQQQELGHVVQKRQLVPSEGELGFAEQDIGHEDPETQEKHRQSSAVADP